MPIVKPLRFLFFFFLDSYANLSILYPTTSIFSQDETRLVVNDVIAMNDTLVGLSLRADTMEHHLEEVEAVVMDVKRATVDDFTDIINSIIPALEQRIEEK